MAYPSSNRRVSFLSLRAYVAVMQHRDAVRAAQALRIHPQRLYYHIRGLEAALGKPLFSTCSPDWLPTSMGVTALPKVVAMLAIWDQIEAGIRASQPAAAAREAEPGAIARYGAAFWVRQATM
ncbi:helix-turn-helix domain-containing protein [Cupriavidus necator]